MFGVYRMLELRATLRILIGRRTAGANLDPRATPGVTGVANRLGSPVYRMLKPFCQRSCSFTATCRSGKREMCYPHQASKDGTHW